MLWNFIYSTHLGSAVKRCFPRLCRFANCGIRKVGKKRPRFPIFQHRRRICFRWFLRLRGFIRKWDARFDSPIFQSLIQGNPFFPLRYRSDFICSLRLFRWCQRDRFATSRARNDLTRSIRWIFNRLPTVRTCTF